jgi:hypothetical protein
MLLGMTAKTNEGENPLRDSLRDSGQAGRALRFVSRLSGQAGPRNFFVVGCAFAPVAGALGYKRTDPSTPTARGCGTRKSAGKRIPRRYVPRNDSENKRGRKPPFETPFETQGKQDEPFDSSRASQGKQGPATFLLWRAPSRRSRALGCKRTNPRRSRRDSVLGCGFDTALGQAVWITSE